MSNILKIKKAKDSNGKEIQHALWSTGHSYEIHRWEEATDSNRIVEEIDYEGYADQLATRAMAMGTLDSLHQQTLHENHGESWTDKNGIAWYWAASLNRYVTIPEND